MLPALAQAHAILVESQPAIGATMPPGPITVRLRYNSRIDHARSRLTLTRPDRTQEVLPTAAADPVDVLSTGALGAGATGTAAPGIEADLAPGRYVIRWQVLAVDGHITRGDVPFTVEATGAASTAAAAR
jgi:methionine-rich copper-binding protein CopC